MPESPNTVGRKSNLQILHVEADGFTAEARREILEFAAFEEQTVTRADLLSGVAHCDVLWVRLGHYIDEEVFQNAKNLKAVVTATTGLNHIDLDAAARHGVEVLCLKGEREFLDTIAATAEHTFALLLAMVRNLPWSFDSVREGHWLREEFSGLDLRGMKLGILGYGRLGTMVAGYARAFGLKVAAHDQLEQKMPSWITRLSLHSLFGESDIVSIHVPLDSSTEGLVGARQIGLMRPGSYLINTSRGEIIDEEALLSALKSGHLSGAAVDVLANERPGRSKMASHALVDYARTANNLLITPHTAGATVGAKARTEVFMAGKLRRWALGRIDENN
jgi:D-3-phosphoglycerate dehydrogenase